MYAEQQVARTIIFLWHVSRRRFCVTDFRAAIGRWKAIRRARKCYNLYGLRRLNFFAAFFEIKNGMFWPPRFCRFPVLNIFTRI